MSSLKDRFDAAQNRAAGIFSRVSLARLVATGHSRNGNEDEREAGFRAGAFITYAGERAVAALQRLRKGKVEAPTITAGDYDRFQELATGIAGALGATCAMVEEALIAECEMACSHAEDAMSRAAGIYTELSLTLEA